MEQPQIYEAMWTLVFTITPSLFAFINAAHPDPKPSADQYLKAKLKAFLIHLPFINLLAIAKFDYEMTKLHQAIKDAKQIRRRSDDASAKSVFDHRRHLDDKRNELMQIQSKLKQFTIYEGFFESAPQFVFQVSTVLKEGQLFHKTFGQVIAFHGPMKMIQILSRSGH